MKKRLAIILICILLIILIIVLPSKNYNINTTTEINNVVIRENSIKDNSLQENTENKAVYINDIKAKYFFATGKITEIEDDVINFTETDGENYKIKISNDMDLINARTEEIINGVSSIEAGDVIDLHKSKEKIVIGIAKNLSGEDLKRELLVNLSLKDPKLDRQQITGIEKINIINKEKAIITIVFSDIYGNYFNNTEEFKEDVIVNSSTEIHSKSGLAYNVETLNNAIDGFVTIVLDRKTIDDEKPIVIYYGQSDT